MTKWLVIQGEQREGFAICCQVWRHLMWEGDSFVFGHSGWIVLYLRNRIVWTCALRVYFFFHKTSCVFKQSVPIQMLLCPVSHDFLLSQINTLGSLTAVFFI